MAKMGDLGCTPVEARNRMDRILKMGLTDMAHEQGSPMTIKHIQFIRDMSEAVENNPDWIPTYGQVTYAEDLKERYL